MHLDLNKLPIAFIRTEADAEVNFWLEGKVGLYAVSGMTMGCKFHMGDDL